MKKTFDAADRAAWRKWLEQHYQTEKEVWLIYYRKQSGKTRISYNDAVEEALCFGWIDSTIRPHDEDSFAQRFSPRRKGSPYSQTNKERLQRLIQQGMVIPDVLATVQDISPGLLTIPDDIRAALHLNATAWQNFQRYSEPYQRIRIAYIQAGRRRPGEFEKRLNHFLKMTEKNKQFGFGIETYY
jgi:uncharacterized protein YdeI (YjbR/CyaY-like superfamily)